MKINWGKITIRELAGIITSYLLKRDIDATLVGGACVSIYSNNKYVSGDLDFIVYEQIRQVKP